MSTVSGPELPSCLHTAGTSAETDTESGRVTVYDSSSVVTTAVVGVCSSPRAETILSGKLLQSMKMLSNNSDTVIWLLTLFLHWTLRCCYQSLDRFRSTTVWARATNEKEKMISLAKNLQSCAWDCS